MFRSFLLHTLVGLGMAAAAVAGVTIVMAPPGIAQQSPIRLFPERGTSPPIEATPAQEGPRLPAPTGQRIPLPSERAAAPEPQGEVAIEGLAPPQVDAIGLSGPIEGGFDRPLWAGSDPELVAKLLADLPVVTLVPPLRELTRRLLVSGSPPGGSEPGRLLALRIERLIAMGDLDAAAAVVDRLPAPATDSVLARRAAEVALRLGDDQSACRLADSLGPTSGAEFWAEVTVYCRLVEGDRSAARLGLDLMREAGQTDDGAFFALASAIADQTAPPRLENLEPSAIHLALLALAEWPLPPNTLAGAEPPVLAAVAREPALAGAHRLRAIEQAFLVGASSADRVAAAYAEQDAAGGADDLPNARSEWDSEARAIAYAAVREAGEPTARGALLNATWQAARGADRFLIAEVFAQPLIELPVERQLAAVAPSVARALLAAERLVPAVSWLSLLTAEAGPDQRAQPAVAGLVPLFALAGVGGSDAVPRIDQAAIDAWQHATVTDQGSAERLFASLEAVGAPIGGDAWQDLLAGHYHRQQAAPATVLWRGLEHAAAERRVGDTVLFVLQMLNGQPEAVHPEVLVACLRALSRVGLDRDARAIALATALISNL